MFFFFEFWQLLKITSLLHFSFLIWRSGNNFSNEKNPGPAGNDSWQTRLSKFLCGDRKQNKAMRCVHIHSTCEVLCCWEPCWDEGSQFQSWLWWHIVQGVFLLTELGSSSFSLSRYLVSTPQVNLPRCRSVQVDSSNAAYKQIQVTE